MHNEVIPNSWVLPNRIGYSQKMFKTFNPEKYPTVQKKATCACEEGVCDLKEDSINLFPQQRFIRDFIQFDSPYRGALLYHELGSGKSGASIAAAEGYINKKKIFILSPKSLAVNYENEIYKISSIGLNLKKDWALVKIKTSKNQASLEILDKKYAITKVKKDALVWIPMYEDDIPEAIVIKRVADEDDRKSINEMISHIIRNRYTFISYNGLSANVMEKLGKSPFDNSFIIIDEVHNFSNTVKNKSNGNSGELYKRIMGATDCKIILLSGTPIINEPYEIMTIINLIRGYIKIYNATYSKKSTRTITTEEFVAKMKEKNLLPLIDEYLIDDVQQKIFFSLLPRGYKKQNEPEIIKSNWGFTEEKAVENIIKALNEIKNTTINTKYDFTLFSALPTNKDEFNNFFLDIKDEENPTVKNNDLFMRRVLGTVSYYSISGSDLFPTRIKPDITKYLYMTDTQFKNYLEVRAIERKMDNAQKGKGGIFGDKVSVYRAFSRMVCNFSFPENIKREYPNDIKRALKKEIDEAEENEDENEEDEEDKKEDKKEEKHKIAEIYEANLKKAIDKLKKGKYLSYENVKKEHSPKFAEMYDDITDSPGSVLVYSQFRNVEGLGLLTEFLNKQGFKEVDIKKIDSEYYLTDPDIFDEEYDDKRYVVFNQDAEKTRFLMNLFNGDFKNLPKEVAKAIPADANQLYGKLVKVFCISASGAEGISLKNVRRVLITEPYWNNNRIEQVIGRAIRSCSHQALPLKDRDVQVYKYSMKFTAKQLKSDYSIETLDKGITTDEHILSMANKKMAIVDQFLKMLKVSSFDCIINSKQNKPLENDYKCYSWAIGVNNNDKSYTDNIKDDYKIMGHRRREVKRKDTGRVVSIKGVKYVEVNKKIYNYFSYVNAGILIPEEI